VPDLDTLQNRVGYSFREAGLLRQSLTHPSVAHEQGAGVPHNQRLEFLGDAVLQLILTRELYTRFPDSSEGPLTKARAQMVNQRSLAEQGLRLELGAHLILGRGEETTGGRERQSTLADAYEALLGAIFLDGGFTVAQEVILRQFRDSFGELEDLPALDNPKGELQELLQSQSPDPATYNLESVSGPDHDRIFECSVQYRGAELGRGKGKTKKAAESEAAIAALKKLRDRAPGAS